MRYKVLAKEDVDDRIGDRHFEVKAGETIEVSAQGAEIALQTGKFEVVREVPETAFEKKKAEASAKANSAAADKAYQEKFDEQFKSLIGLTKEELVAKAGELQLENFSELKKEPLAKFIAEALI